jgi:hypothetical protein
MRLIRDVELDCSHLVASINSHPPKLTLPMPIHDAQATPFHHRLALEILITPSHKKSKANVLYPIECMLPTTLINDHICSYHNGCHLSSPTFFFSLLSSINEYRDAERCQELQRVIDVLSHNVNDPLSNAALSLQMVVRVESTQMPQAASDLAKR